MSAPLRGDGMEGRWRARRGEADLLAVCLQDAATAALHAHGGAGAGVVRLYWWRWRWPREGVEPEDGVGPY